MSGKTGGHAADIACGGDTVLTSKQTILMP
jgi:hypothetical protein